MRALLALLLALLALPLQAKELYWQTLDSLAGGDRALAEQTLFPMWGDDPRAWPDWIDPAALYVPTTHDRLLVVRQPVRAPCGQYRFVVLGPVTAQRTRETMGDFCAGTIDVIWVAGRDWPDLLLSEGRSQDPDGAWQRLDQRVRWHDGQWWRVLRPE